MKNKQIAIALFAVIAIGGVKGSPAKAWSIRQGDNFDTPETRSIKADIKALKDYQAVLDHKKDLLNIEIDKVASLRDRKEDKLNATYRDLKEDLKRERATSARADYSIDPLRLDNYRHDKTEAKLARESIAEYNYDYSGKPLGRESKALGRDTNPYTGNLAEYRRPSGIYYEGGN
jgi:ribosomal protein L29